MLDEPDSREIVEQVIVAELRASALLRRCMQSKPNAEAWRWQPLPSLVPGAALAGFRDLQSMTRETGEAWVRRVDAVLHAALDPRHVGDNCCADPACTVLLRPMVLGVARTATSAA